MKKERVEMKNWQSTVAAVALLLVLSACKQTQEQSPSAFYADYYAKSAAGFASFDEDAEYHSKRKRAEVEGKMPAMMQNMGKTREEVITIYLNMSKAVAQCKKIELTGQQVRENTAQLTYRQLDTCGNTSSTPQIQHVRLVNEDGWKIDHVEISL